MERVEIKLQADGATEYRRFLRQFGMYATRRALCCMLLNRKGIEN